tara:strand:+ start:1087 stop:1269 length:183 start_codon:yes stop_codon:yes gene_type:complete
MKELVDTNPQVGNDDNVLATMKAFNLPMTKDTYLELAYMGEVPDQIDAEVLANMPEEFRK